VHLLSFVNPRVCPLLPFSHTCTCPFSLPYVLFISHALYFMLICPLALDMHPLFLPHVCTSCIYVLERSPHCSSLTFFSGSNLCLFHCSFFFLASSLFIRNNTLLVFVLVFSGAINLLARARIKFWCVGIKLLDLVGIVIDFLCIVRSSILLLWCFSLVSCNSAFFPVFPFVKILMLQDFSFKQISNCVTYRFGSLATSQRHFFLLLFSGYICRFLRFRTTRRKLGTPP
jgi:hypothetical protein